jgi:phosphoribosylglycinamide formyltransferase
VIGLIVYQNPVSNRKNAFGLKRAANENIPTSYHNLLAYKKKYEDDAVRARAEYDQDLAVLVRADRPHLVVCAGWMHSKMQQVRSC